MAVVAATANGMPATVATQFDGAGRPIAWSSQRGYLTHLGFFGLGLPIGLILMVTLVGRGGPQRFNLPYRAYWMRSPNRETAVGLVRAYMWWLACVLTGAVVAVHLLIVRAHASSPPHLRTRPFLGILGLILLGIAGWIVGWFRIFRPPPLM